MNKKIGTLSLSGFMIGPILGSGIILLPPIAFEKIGNQSIYTWIIMMILGGLFAMIFAKLSIKYPGDGGMTIAIEKILGKKYKLFSSLLLIAAVTFGPTAVMLTASKFIEQLDIFNGMNDAVISIIMVGCIFFILLNDVKFVSTLSLVISTIISIIILVSSIFIILNNNIVLSPFNEIQIVPFGEVLLLLFWAIIGWEIVGNYSEQVQDTKKTIRTATIFSLIIISGIYIIVALAFQALPAKNNLSLIDILYPLFKNSSVYVLVILATGLCLTTYLTIVGAVSRLMSSLSTENYLPQFLHKKNKNNIPYFSLLYFTTIHITVLILYNVNILDIEKIVSIANGFFLVNAVIGLIAALRIIDELVYKLGAVILIISLIIILTFSSFITYIGLGFVLLIALYLAKKKNEK